MKVVFANNDYNNRLNFEWLNKNISYLGKLFNCDLVIYINITNNFGMLKKKLGEDIPDWVIGGNRSNDVFVLDPLLWPKKNISTFEQIILHEIVHVIIHHILKVEPSLWINEGLAIIFAEQIDQIEENGNAKVLNPYNLTYDDNLYFHSAKVIQYIFENYQEKETINHLISLESFVDDNIFGYESVSNICSIINQRMEIL